jgi:hypothetical protein
MTGKMPFDYGSYGGIMINIEAFASSWPGVIAISILTGIAMAVIVGTIRAFTDPEMRRWRAENDTVVRELMASIERTERMGLIRKRKERESA